MTRLAKLMAAASFAFATLPAPALLAQEGYPNRPIRVIVGFPPGGGVDVVARLLADKLGQLLGQTIVVENRGGAAGIIAGQQVSRAEPDGYTVLISGGSIIPAQLTNANSGLNILRDLRAVASVAPQASIVVASPGLDVSSLKDLIRLAKTRNLTYASPGSGSIPQLLFEQLFTATAQAPMTHVPFPGAAPALTATMSNQTDVGIVTLPPAVELLNAGKLKGVVVTTPDRSAAVPKIPTAIESGYPGISSALWTGFFVPATTPAGISARLGEAILKAAAMPDIQAKLRQLGYESTSVPGEQFQRDVAKEFGM